MERAKRADRWSQCRAGDRAIDSDERHCDRVELSWPALGATFDVIVRGGGADDDTAVYVLAGRRRARTIADLGRADDVAYSPVAAATFATATAAGRRQYVAGDLHAVFGARAPGPATVCVVSGPRLLACRAVTVGAEPEQVLALDLASR